MKAEAVHKIVSATYHYSICVSTSIIAYEIVQLSPAFLVPGTDFMEDNFSTGQGWGEWFQGDSST